MKLIHLSDLHITQEPARLFGIDPAQRLRDCIASINEQHGDADLCIITGDLSNDGSVASYESLRGFLSDLTVPVRLILGNHDHRENFKAVFPEHATEPDGFVQSVWTDRGCRLLLIDTLDEGRIGGVLCGQRLAWIDRQLSEAAGEDVYIFMHHPAFPIGLRHHQEIGLAHPEAFADLCRRHGNVRHLFAGHVHAEIHAVSPDGLPMAVTRGLAHHLLFDLHNRDARYVAHSPAYSVVLIENGTALVHFYDAMHTSEVIGTSELPDAESLAR